MGGGGILVGVGEMGYGKVLPFLVVQLPVLLSRVLSDCSRQSLYVSTGILLKYILSRARPNKTTIRPMIKR